MFCFQSLSETFSLCTKSVLLVMNTGDTNEIGEIKGKRTDVSLVYLFDVSFVCNQRMTKINGTEDELIFK